MKLYPLYEFPPSLEDLEKLLKVIDLNTHLSIEQTRNTVSQLYGKRSSRTNIQIKDLKKLGLIEINDNVSLSWETQLYIDLDRDLRDLLIYNVYRLESLFNVCKLICDIDPTLSLTNPSLHEKLLGYGYKVENKRTSVEKLYAIKRLIKSCQIVNELNPFLGYERYMAFLSLLQETYIQSVGQYKKNAVLANLHSALCELGFKEKEVDEYFAKLYKDPVFAAYTSFSTVNMEFAKENYITILNDQLYYVKIIESFLIKNGGRK